MDCLEGDQGSVRICGSETGLLRGTLVQAGPEIVEVDCLEGETKVQSESVEVRLDC